MSRARESDAVLLSTTGGWAFERFYLRHVDVVAQYVQRRVDRPDLVLDVVSETFARALENRSRFDEKRGPAIAWLLTIARNVLLDSIRRGRVADDTRRRLQMQPLDLNDGDLEAVVARTHQPLTAALAGLPLDQREAVRRRILEEEPYAAIASDVGCSEQVVRQRVRRGLLLLRGRAAQEHG